MRKPFIVEFTGTPEAGKTTVINEVVRSLINQGFKVKLYPESAEESKKFFNTATQDSKLWISLNTIKNVIEATALEDYDIVFFDRGSYDIKFWFYMDSIYNFNYAVKNAYLAPIIEDYPPDLLITFIVSPDESIRRRGGEGRVVTREFVKNYNNLLDIFINSVRINKGIVRTDNTPVPQVVDTVQNLILENINKEP